MKEKKLQIQQLNNKMLSYINLQAVFRPSSGWVKAIRLALGISLEQVGKKLSIAKQNVMALEEREKRGTITLKTLQHVAEVLDMQLVYGFVPKDGSLEALIQRKAKALATQIVMRAFQTMKLEDQEISPARLQKAIEEKTTDLKNELPKILWD